MPHYQAQLPVVSLGGTRPAARRPFLSVVVDASKAKLVGDGFAAPNGDCPGADPVRVLLVSPSAEDETRLRGILAHPKWPVWTAPSLADALRLLKQVSFTVAVCESHLPDGTWREFLDRVALMQHGPEVIVASLTADDSLWAEALNVGAWDVLSKPFSRKEVLHVVGTAALKASSERRPSSLTGSASAS